MAKRDRREQIDDSSRRRFLSGLGKLGAAVMTPSSALSQDRTGIDLISSDSVDDIAVSQAAGGDLWAHLLNGTANGVPFVTKWSVDGEEQLHFLRYEETETETLDVPARLVQVLPDDDPLRQRYEQGERIRDLFSDLGIDDEDAGAYWDRLESLKTLDTYLRQNRAEMQVAETGDVPCSYRDGAFYIGSAPYPNVQWFPVHQTEEYEIFVGDGTTYIPLRNGATPEDILQQETYESIENGEGRMSVLDEDEFAWYTATMDVDTERLYNEV